MDSISAFHHPEFLKRLAIFVIAVVGIVRTLAIVFNRVLMIRYPLGLEVLVNIVTIGLLTVVFITDYGMAAKAAAILIGGSFFGVWQDARAKRRNERNSPS